MKTLAMLLCTPEGCNVHTTDPVITEDEFEQFKKDLEIKFEKFMKEEKVIRAETYKLASEMYLGRK